MLLSQKTLVKYVLPTLVMGRDNLWDGIGSDGFRYLDHLPDWMRAKNGTDKTRMTIPMVNGSIFQIAGTDNPDSLRGGNAKLYIFSEWAEHDPYAWDVVEPILRENDGIAIFNTTPRGDNHARSMLEYAKNNPKWYTQILTAEDTNVWTPEQLAEIKKDITQRFAAQGRSEVEALAYFEQEYMCSFKSPVIGSYYGEGIRKAEDEHRITRVPLQEGLQVHTAWDLGIDDSMSIWFIQFVGQEIHIIDYYENSGEGLAHYILKMQEKRGYVYGKHWAPHDIEVRELGTGKSRWEIARSLGVKFEVGKRLEVEDGINAARSLLSRCWFDEEKCARGLAALKNYRKEWDEKNKVFRKSAKHDWASHGADAFRTFATGYKVPYITPKTPLDGSGIIKPWGGVDKFIEGVG